MIAELRALGVRVEEDAAGEQIGCDCGNLLARVSGDRGGARAVLTEPARASLLLCAHLDTVPPQAPIEPVLREGVWENEHAGILGADNKAAIVVLLALARHIHAEGAPLDLELLFTVAEERSLAGARAFDVGRLRSQLGFVCDHASPIGEVIVAAPSHYRFEATFLGAAAHAGLRAAGGRSAVLAAARAVAALPAGQVDEQSTVNVGVIEGGSAINVVPERCVVAGEVRSLEEARAEELVADVVARCYEAANLAGSECDVDVSAEKTFSCYRLTPRSRPLAVAEAALRACGREAVRISTGAGSDANVLLARGFECVNLANGTEHAHEPCERVSEDALHDMFEVALALLDEAVQVLA